MTQVLLVCLVVAAIVLLRTHASWETILPFVAVLGVAIARPVVFFGDPAGALHAGIAPAFPVVYSSAIVAVVVLVGMRRGSTGSTSIALAVWLVLVWAFMFAGADSTSAQWSGLASLTVAAVCFAAGRTAHTLLGAPRGASAFALAVLAFMLVQLAVGLAQASGVVALEASDQGLMRVRGTFGHAGDLGKVVIAATAVSLACLAVSRDPRTRRVVLMTIGAAFVLTGLTASRSNLAGLVVLLVAWALLAREPTTRRLGRRFLLLGGAAALPFAGTYVLRFTADPDGGSRPELLSAALEQLRRSPIEGTGLNSYIQVVGMWDGRTASGLPVHNAFLLTAAEVGLPLFAIVAAIALAVIGRVALRRPGSEADFRAPLLAYALALVFLGLTGWGVLKVTVLPFMALVLGLLVPPRNQPVSREPEESRGTATPVHATR